MLKTKVKAGSITHLTDARYFAAWEVEWLGFNLIAGDENSVGGRMLAALREWVDGVKICGEFGLASAEEIAAAITEHELDTVQLGMLIPTTTLAALRGKAELIQEVVVEGYLQADELNDILTERAANVDYFLLNFTKGGITWNDLQAGTPFSLDQLRQWSQSYPILLDLSLDVTEPSKAIEHLSIAGFSVQGGAEEKVGYKSFDDLDGFFEDLEELV